MKEETREEITKPHKEIIDIFSSCYHKAASGWDVCRMVFPTLPFLFFSLLDFSDVRLESDSTTATLQYWQQRVWLGTCRVVLCCRNRYM